MFRKRVIGVWILENSCKYELISEIRQWIEQHNIFKIIDIKFSSYELTTSCMGNVENQIKYQAMIIYG